MLHGNPKLNTTVMVYVSTFDEATEVQAVSPAIRNEMIQQCSDKLTKLQRYCVWKLLDYALRDCYGGGVDDFNLYVDDNGKWSSHNLVELSLAHSNNVVVVALCNHFVGVDIEQVSRFARYVDDVNFAERILTENEIVKLHGTPVQRKAQALAEMWTKKESFFKLGSRSAFTPKAYDTTVKSIHSQLVTIDGIEYALSVARYIPSKIELKQVTIGY